jgi:SAM-dependent methyltransferase
MTFTHPGDSHAHSLVTLNQLYQYEDFINSVSTVIDLGCGSGEDLAWWATRTTRDENPTPLNIRCTGIDLAAQLPMTTRYNNVFYQSGDFENTILSTPMGFDVLWCHDAFQYAHAPVATLSKWWHLASPGAMLYLAMPTTQRVYRNQLDYHLPSGTYYHHTMVSLIHMLATAGWDCATGFFKQDTADSWIHAVVYKSSQEPLDPKTTTWHKLAELKLLPLTAEKSIQAHNYLRQQDLVIPWIYHSLMTMSVR